MASEAVIDVCCTVCDVELSSCVTTYAHPALPVAICGLCHDALQAKKGCLQDDDDDDDDVQDDDDDDDDTCAWCGAGGEVALCDSCDKAWCADCLERHLGEDEARSIFSSGDDAPWKCVACDPSSKKIAALREQLETVLARQQHREDPGETTTNTARKRMRKHSAWTALHAMESEVSAAQESLEDESLEALRTAIQDEAVTREVADRDFNEVLRLRRRKLDLLEREHAATQDRAELAGVDLAPFYMELEAATAAGQIHMDTDTWHRAPKLALRKNGRVRRVVERQRRRGQGKGGGGFSEEEEDDDDEDDAVGVGGNKKKDDDNESVASYEAPSDSEALECLKRAAADLEKRFPIKRKRTAGGGYVLDGEFAAAAGFDQRRRDALGEAVFDAVYHSDKPSQTAAMIRQAKGDDRLVSDADAIDELDDAWLDVPDDERALFERNEAARAGDAAKIKRCSEEDDRKRERHYAAAAAAASKQANNKKKTSHVEEKNPRASDEEDVVAETKVAAPVNKEEEASTTTPPPRVVVLDDNDDDEEMMIPPLELASPAYEPLHEKKKKKKKRPDDDDDDDDGGGGALKDDDTVAGTTHKKARRAPSFEEARRVPNSTKADVMLYLPVLQKSVFVRLPTDGGLATLGRESPAPRDNFYAICGSDNHKISRCAAEVRRAEGRQIRLKHPPAVKTKIRINGVLLAAGTEATLLEDVTAVLFGQGVAYADACAFVYVLLPVRGDKGDDDLDDDGETSYFSVPEFDEDDFVAVVARKTKKPTTAAPSATTTPVKKNGGGKEDSGGQSPRIVIDGSAALSSAMLSQRRNKSSSIVQDGTPSFGLPKRRDLKDHEELEAELSQETRDARKREEDKRRRLAERARSRSRSRSGRGFSSPPMSSHKKSSKVAVVDLTGDDDDDDVVVVLDDDDGAKESSSSSSAVKKTKKKKDVIDVIDEEEVLLLDEPDVKIPSYLASKLKDHQVQGARFLYDQTIESIEALEKSNEGNDGCILAHSMGLGKTLTCVAYLSSLLGHPKASKVIRTALIVAPCNVIKNWESEFFKWCHTDRKLVRRVVVIAASSSKAQRIRQLDLWQRQGGVCVIAYEMYAALTDPATPKAAATKKAKESLDDLFDRGVLRAGKGLVSLTTRPDVRADVLAGGILSYKGKTYKDPSSFARAVDALVAARSFEENDDDDDDDDEPSSFPTTTTTTTTTTTNGGARKAANSKKPTKKEEEDAYLRVTYEGRPLSELLEDEPNHAMLQFQDQRQKARFACQDPGPDVIILDEAHNSIKNTTSKRAKALGAVRTKRRIAITGTPLQNNLREYWAMITYVRGPVVGNAREFKKNFEDPIKNGMCSDSTDADIRRSKRKTFVLNKKIEHFVLRRDDALLSEEVGKCEYLIIIKFTPFQRSLYGSFMGRAKGIFASHQPVMKLGNNPITYLLDKDTQALVDAMPAVVPPPKAATKAAVLATTTTTNGSNNAQQAPQEQHDAIIDVDAITDMVVADGAQFQRRKKKKKKKKKSSEDDDDDDEDDDLEDFLAGDDDDDDDDDEEAEQGHSTKATTTNEEDSSSDSSSSSSKKKKKKDEEPSRVEAGSSEEEEKAAPVVEAEEEEENNEVPFVCEVVQKLRAELGCVDVVNEASVAATVQLSTKTKILFEIVARSLAVGDKVVIFSQSLSSLSYVEHVFQSREWVRDRASIGGVPAKDAAEPRWRDGADYFRIDGAVDSTDRQQMVTRFLSDARARVFLLSTRAGKEGINLVSANRVILFDTSFNPANDRQALFRAYRFGQKKDVKVYRLVAQGFENWIRRYAMQKEFLSKRVVDDHACARIFGANELDVRAKLDDDDDDDDHKRDDDIGDAVLYDTVQRHRADVIECSATESLFAENNDEKLDDNEKEAALEEHKAELEAKANNGTSSTTTPAPLLAPGDDAILEDARRGLPPAWRAAWDQNLHKIYYFQVDPITHANVGQPTWEKPTSTV